MQRNDIPTSQPPTWLTIAEACQYARLSRTTFKKLIRSGRLPVYRPTGKRVLIKRDELDQSLMTTACQ